MTSQQHPAGRALILAAVLVLATGCLFSPDESDNTPPPPEPIPAPTSPANIIRALEIIYDSAQKSASERQEAYRNLFVDPSTARRDTLPPFVFRFQEVDIVEGGLPASWGLDDELRVHENMFRAQEDREIFSLSLDILAQAPRPPEFGEAPDDWLVVSVTNVDLELLHNPEDGLAVTRGQAEFLFSPEGNRWYLRDWKDLPAAQ